MEAEPRSQGHNFECKYSALMVFVKVIIFPCFLVRTRTWIPGTSPRTRPSSIFTVRSLIDVRWSKPLGTRHGEVSRGTKLLEARRGPPPRSAMDITTRPTSPIGRWFTSGPARQSLAPRRPQPRLLALIVSGVWGKLYEFGPGRNYVRRCFSADWLWFAAVTAAWARASSVILVPLGVVRRCKATGIHPADWSGPHMSGNYNSGRTAKTAGHFEPLSSSTRVSMYGRESWQHYVVC